MFIKHQLALEGGSQIARTNVEKIIVSFGVRVTKFLALIRKLELDISCLHWYM